MDLYRSIIIYTLIICCSFLPRYIAAQERKISGSVKNSSDEPLGLASVNLVNENEVILAYTASDKQGKFLLNYPKIGNAKVLFLQVSYLGYGKQSKPIVFQTDHYSFMLKQDSTILEEVLVRRKSIISNRGDTLSYDVESFAHKNDRSIGDVLRRLPGIDIAPDGSIYHNNKKIENLYIHGDDLMSGRYGLATRAIRKEMIVSVDVLNNHQPIEVLKNKVLSDKTSINLVLKDEKSFKLSTELDLALGLPRNYDIAATPILLNRDIKLLASVAINNVGIDYKSDFKQLGNTNFISSIKEDQNIPPLSLGTVQPPDVPLSNYYINISKVLNVNILRKNSKGLNFKVNVQGFTDAHSLEYTNRTENYLPNDTIVYHEQQLINNRPSMFQTTFTVMANKENFFFNNSFTIFTGKENNGSDMYFNEYSFSQSLRKTRTEFSNDLNWMPKLPGNGIGEIRWLISYGRNKEALDIGKGFLFETPQYTGIHDAVTQRMFAPRIYSNAYLAYKIVDEVFNQEYKAGIIHEKQELESNLDFFADKQDQPYQLDDGNNVLWNKQIAYFLPEYQLKYKKIQSVVKLPINYQYIRYRQDSYYPYSDNTDFYFNPSIDFKYSVTPENVIRANYNSSNTFGNISDIYGGNILRNYQTLHKNDANLQTRKVNSASLTYDFQKSIKLLFANISLSSDKIKTDHILSTVYEDNIQKSVLLPYKNQTQITRLNAGMSKYIFSAKSTLSIKTQLHKSSFDQLINNTIQPFSTNGIRINTNIKRKIFGIDVDYGNVSSWNFTKSPHTSTTNTQHNYRAFRIDQILTISADLSKAIRVEMNNKHSFAQQSNVENNTKYFFSDVKISHVRAKHNFHIDLEISNLFNVKEYTLLSMDAYQLFSSTYKLRGRMMMLRCNYLF